MLRIVGEWTFRVSGAGLPLGRAIEGVQVRVLGREGGSNSVVESQPSKLLVAGSIPVSRSTLRPACAPLASEDGTELTAAPM